MRRVFILILAFLLILAPAGLALAEEDLIYNGDFSVSSADAPLPAGWDLSAYVDTDDYLEYGTTDDPDVGSCVFLDNIRSNDSRILQTAAVEPDTVYLISALIRTEGVEGMLGATLTVDNYQLDGTYCYSDPVTGTTDWEQIRLYVRTSESQTFLRVGMRLGGYSMESVGTAFFSAVSMVKTESYPEEDVIDIAYDTGVSYAAGGNSGYIPSDPATDHPFVLMLIFTAAAAFAGVFIYFRYFRRKPAFRDVSKENARYILAAILILSAVLKVLLSMIFIGHSTDINCFMAWGNAMLNGPREFYTSGMFADYPPGYMYVLWLMTVIARLFGMQYGTAAYALMFKLPSIAADTAACVLLYRTASEKTRDRSGALLLTGLLAFHPAVAYISGAWGQIDSILSLGLVLTCMLFLNDRRIAAGALYGLMILIKPQALMLGPILAVAYFSGIHGDPVPKRLLKAAFSVLAALAVLFVLSLPFKGTQGPLWLVDKYVSTAGSYAYASIEAFNFHALIGGNWKPVDTPLFLGVTYKMLGTAGIVLSALGACALLLKSCKKHAGALYLSGAFMLAMIFTFGHFMHERYIVPALFLLLAAYVAERDRRLIAAFIALSVPLFLNVISAMFIVDHQAMRGGIYEGIVFAGSLLETLAALYLAYISVDILVRDHIVLPETSRGERKAPALRALPGKAPAVPAWTKGEILALAAFVLAYAVIAFLNLGTLSAPETCWQPASLGETVLIRFPGKTHVTKYEVFPNIGSPNISECGSMMLSTSDGEQGLYTQSYDNMFRWKSYECDFESDSVMLTLYSGTLQINEIAFFDEAGNLIPASVAEPSGTQAFLLDEQDTVPEIPSYLNGMYFDELYHARTAYEHLHNLKPYENSHPPLGKLLIMAGVALFGMCPFGWRFTGTLFGVLMLPVMYCFGRRLFKRRDYALMLTVLFAFDFMHFTQTRIATIDVYGVFFILLMFYFMYVYVSMDPFREPLRRMLKPLALSGLFFGLGISSKWICFYAGGGLAVLLFYTVFQNWLVYRDCMKRGDPEEVSIVRDYPKKVLLTLLYCVLFFVVIPGCIYFLSYLPYYRYEASVSGSYGFRDMFRTFWNYQNFMYSYHSGLKATHPYQSSYWQWPFTSKPMWYYYGERTGNTVSTLTASGNPAVWWNSSVAAAALLGLRAAGKVKPDRSLQMILIGVLSNYLPWVLVSRCTFIYHFFATVPFILMAAVYLMYWAEERYPRLRTLKWLWPAVAILFFVLLYPGISGLRIPAGWASFLKALPGGKLMYGA